MSDRKPLPATPLNQELRELIQRRYGMRPTDAEGMPLGLTDEEKKAAANPGLPAPPKEKPVEPLISPKLAAAAAAIGTLLASAGLFFVGSALLPAWAPLTLWALGSFVLFLAGKAAPPFKALGPLVPAAAVPFIGSVATVLGGFAANLSPGRLQSALLLVTSVLLYLTGKAGPQEMSIGAAPPRA